MKLFKIELDNVGYDDYDSCIIVAESKEQVEELCKCNFVNYLQSKDCRLSVGFRKLHFLLHQMLQ